MSIGLSLFIALLGAVLIRIGRRGRRVDDHPVCRRCGFDLTGRPEGSERCSECGTDLRTPRAIQDGRRERRSGMIATGGLLLALGVVVGGAALWARVSSADAQRFKPTWWLVREIDSADIITGAAAARELSARVAAGSVSQANIDAAADKILAIQGTPQAKWDAAFGDVVEDARLAKMLSDQRYAQYATQAPALAINARPTVNAGDVLPFWIRHLPPRVGSRRALRVEYTTTFQVDDFDVAIPYAVSDEQVLAMTSSGGATGANVELKKYADRLLPGKHELHALLTVRMHAANNPPGSPPVAWTKWKRTAAFELVPAEQSTVKVVDDESLRTEIEGSVAVSGVEYGRIAKDALDFRAELRGNPVGVGFEVFVVTPDGKRHRASTFASPSRGFNSTSTSLMRATVPNLTAATVDFVFVPDVDAAKGTTDVFEIWNGQVTKRGVPVKFATPPPTTKGAS